MGASGAAGPMPPVGSLWVVDAARTIGHGVDRVPALTLGQLLLVVGVDPPWVLVSVEGGAGRMPHWSFAPDGPLRRVG